MKTLGSEGLYYKCLVLVCNTETADGLLQHITIRNGFEHRECTERFCCCCCCCHSCC